MGNLGTNIRDLREAFGETQLELAQALGLESSATVSMYESGDRGQNNYEVIANIAYHYRITADQLINGDFSGWDMRSIRLEDRNFAKHAFECILPVLCTEEANDNSEFRKTFEIHSELHSRIHERRTVTKKEIISCVKAYDSLPQLEARANTMWLLLYYGAILQYGEMLEGIHLVQDEKLSKAQFYKELYLRDISAEERERRMQLEKRRADYFSEYGEKLRRILGRLHADPNWREEACYFMALRYVFNLVQNLQSDAENFRIGNEMIRSLSAMGNHYAQQYRRIADQLHKV